MEQPTGLFVTYQWSTSSYNTIANMVITDIAILNSVISTEEDIEAITETITEEIERRLSKTSTLVKSTIKLEVEVVLLDWKWLPDRYNLY